MTYSKMYLYGASGHAKVVIDLLRLRGIDVDVLVDDDVSRSKLAGKAVVHDSKELTPFIVCIGDNRARRDVVTKLGDGRFAPAAVHPRAAVAESAIIGEGTVVMAGAVIQADARIGRHCIVNSGASIDHDCVVGDFAHISPGATLCGAVNVGEGAHVGAGATVIQCLNVGAWATVGAGATVISDIPDGTTAVGVPAKVITQTNNPQIARADDLVNRDFTLI